MPVDRLSAQVAFLQRASVRSIARARLRCMQKPLASVEAALRRHILGVGPSAPASRAWLSIGLQPPRKCFCHFSRALFFARLSGGHDFSGAVVACLQRGFKPLRSALCSFALTQRDAKPPIQTGENVTVRHHQPGAPTAPSAFPHNRLLKRPAPLHTVQASQISVTKYPWHTSQKQVRWRPRL